MNTECLKTFIALANFRNFTRTSRELAVVQSTVSSRIKSLEAEIGQKLFNRDKNNVTLTKVGEEFLPYAIKMVGIEEYFRAKTNMSAQYSENLCITCSHALFDCYVSRYAVEFIQENPNTSLKLSLMHSEEIMPLLGTGNVDVAYMNYPFHHDRYLCRPFVRERVVLVTNIRNTKYARGSSREELLDTQMIFSDIMDNNFEYLLPSQRIYPLDINIFSKILPFLKSGDWYSFLPLGVVKNDIEDGSLIEIPLKDFRLSEKQSYMVFRRDYPDFKPLARWIALSPGEELP